MDHSLLQVTQRIRGSDERRLLGTVTYQPWWDRYIADSMRSRPDTPPTVFFDLRKAVLWVVREDLRAGED